jgi:hypothetical protein
LFELSLQPWKVISFSQFYTRWVARTLKPIL